MASQLIKGKEIAKASSKFLAIASVLGVVSIPRRAFCYGRLVAVRCSVTRAAEPCHDSLLRGRVAFSEARALGE